MRHLDNPIILAESATVLLSTFKIEAFLLSSLEIGMVYDCSVENPKNKIADC